ncbi:MAG: hypothetical protein LBF61_04870 [Azoarcus sp.]|jgi:hypothetical protein|nr:hypothetical protein [Azoarcus sp.]
MRTIAPLAHVMSGDAEQGGDDVRGIAGFLHDVRRESVGDMVQDSSPLPAVIFSPLCPLYLWQGDKRLANARPSP